MHAGKALLAGVGLLLLAAIAYLGVAWFFEGARVGPVKSWYRSAKGYTPAKSAEDAMDKFRLAIEKRDYDAAGQYLSGEYKEWFDKGTEDAGLLGREIDNLKEAMKKHNVKSDKGSLILFLLDPFPGGFKYTVSKGEGDSRKATMDWSEMRAPYSGQDVRDWRVEPKILNSLLPTSLVLASSMEVTVKKESDGHWRIQIPVSSGNSLTARHLRDTVDYLRKNGSNYKNALQGLKNDVKNEPQTKENFESALKTKLDQSK